MKSINIIPLKARICECCNGSEFEPLWQYKHTTTTRTSQWLFTVHNVICKSCGFIFTAPVLHDDVLLEYYQDSFSRLAGQILDYSVEKRIKIIKEFVPKGSTFLEVGANLISEFHCELRKHVSKVFTLEPNQSAESDFRSVDELSKIKVDCVAHYFVLEHVPNVASFLRHYANVLKDGGIMICEVPTLDLYDSHIAPLILFEHVNHFTKATLEHIAAKQGLKFIHISTEDCSRPFGSVMVFRKMSDAATKLPLEYERNKSLFNKGLKKVQYFFDLLAKGWEIIKDSEKENKTVIVWAANENSNRLFDGKEIPSHVVVIDSDPRKANYFGNNSVFQPIDKALDIQAASKIIICSRHYSQVILQSISNDFNKRFDINDIFIIEPC